MTLLEPRCYAQINRTRRQRGYSFEYHIVQGFINTENWNAKRLGGSSSFLPDIIATNSAKGTLLSIECKSGDTDTLYIPRDQLDRCKDITDNFLSYYPKRYIVLAFKFKANKQKNRKLHYYFLITSNIEYSDNLKGVKLSWKDCKLIPSFYSSDNNNNNNTKNMFEVSTYLETHTLANFTELII